MHSKRRFPSMDQIELRFWKLSCLDLDLENCLTSPIWCFPVMYQQQCIHKTEPKMRDFSSCAIFKPEPGISFAYLTSLFSIQPSSNQEIQTLRPNKAQDQICKEWTSEISWARRWSQEAAQPEENVREIKNYENQHLWSRFLHQFLVLHGSFAIISNFLLRSAESRRCSRHLNPHIHPLAPVA